MPPQPSFERKIGPVQATAINMTQMCGIGPFVTIPAMVATIGGPEAMFGWIIGAILALADGMVWSELGAAMPGAGGTYLYLREAFQYRTGRLMPFLFIWTAVLAIPLIMSTGVIGLLKYLAYYGPELVKTDPTPAASEVTVASSLIALTPAGIAASLAVVAIVVFALYRNITSIKRLTIGLWVVMFLSVAGVIAASLTHFDPRQAFDFPEDG